MELRAAGLIVYRKILMGFEYLLVQTSYGHHHWTPPKGLVDMGETEFETAIRETFEESGFTESDLNIETDFKKVLRYAVNGRPKSVTYWLAELRVNKEVVLSSEHQAHKWVRLNEACKLVGYPEFQALLKECEEYLRETKTP